MNHSSGRGLTAAFFWQRWVWCEPFWCSRGPSPTRFGAEVGFGRGGIGAKACGSTKLAMRSRKRNKTYTIACAGEAPVAIHLHFPHIFTTATPHASRHPPTPPSGHRPSLLQMASSRERAEGVDHVKSSTREHWAKVLSNCLPSTALETYLPNSLMGHSTIRATYIPTSAADARTILVPGRRPREETGHHLHLKSIASRTRLPQPSAHQEVQTQK